MATLYVSTSGNNNNSGTSPSSPKQTIQAAINAARAGDTIKIMGGTYAASAAEPAVIINKPLTVTAYNTEPVIIDGANYTYPDPTLTYFQADREKIHPRDASRFASWAGLVEIQASNVTLTDVIIQNSKGRGILVNAAGADIDSVWIEDVLVRHCRNQGMNLQNARNCTFKNCEFFDCNNHKWSPTAGLGLGYFKPTIPNKSWPNPATAPVWNFPYGAVINGGFGRSGTPYGNLMFDGIYIHSCYNSGMDVNGRNGADFENVTIRNSIIHTVYAEAFGMQSQRKFTYENNIIYVMGDGPTRGTGWLNGPPVYRQGFYCQPNEGEPNMPHGNTEDVIVRNNLIVGFQAAFMFGQEPVSVGYVNRVTVANNTIVVPGGTYANGAPHIGLTYGLNDGLPHRDLVFANNAVFVAADGAAAGINKGNPSGVLSCHHNYWTKTPPAFAQGNGDIYGGTHGMSNPGVVITPPNMLALSNYRIGADSDLIEAAVALDDVPLDFFGTRRDVRIPDIGFHEYVKETIQADFSASPLDGQAPLAVAFRDRSTGSPAATSWLWDFGDGSVSNQQNPTHKYNAGTHTVSLRVANAVSSSIITKSSYITAEAVTPDAVPRITEGLQVLYRFDQRSGNKVFDVSGQGVPLDLVISDLARVEWTSAGLAITQPTLIASMGPAEKINEACRESNEVTIEVWCTPANKTQDGPARILSLSQNVHSRNLTLGQGLWGNQARDLYDVRLRTTERSANGMPSFSTPSGTVRTEKTHIIFTRKRTGLVRIHLNGVVVSESNIPGDLSTWNPRFPLLLGNETTGEYPWLGQIHLVAVYDRFLSSTEVRGNYRAGTQSAADEGTSTVLLSTFRRFVLASSNGNGFFGGTATTPVAYGVQYPDARCVVCASHGNNGMVIYADVNRVLQTYGDQDVELQWLD